MENGLKHYAFRVLIGVIVIVTMPVWWAIIAVALVGFLAVGVLHALGERALEIIADIRSRGEA